jgi:hypothetical protein
MLNLEKIGSVLIAKRRKEYEQEEINEDEDIPLNAAEKDQREKIKDLKTKGNKKQMSYGLKNKNVMGKEDVFDEQNEPIEENN